LPEREEKRWSERHGDCALSGVQVCDSAKNRSRGLILMMIDKSQWLHNNDACVAEDLLIRPATAGSRASPFTCCSFPNWPLRPRFN